MTIIALSGWKGSGKDTVADYLVKEYGYVRISFADRLKEMVSQQYDLPLEWMHEPGKKEMPLTQYPVIPGDPFSEQLQEMLQSELKSGFWTPRALCILEGSVKRSVYSNYWVRTAVAGIESGQNYVVSDMRYATEADTLKLLLPDLITARVERFDSVDTQDPSERNLDTYNFDWTIQNRGTRSELHENIDFYIGSISGHERLHEE